MAKQLKRIPAVDERYSELLSISPLPVAIHIGGHVVYANKAALTFIQAKKLSDVVGKQILTFIHPDYQALVQKRMIALMTGKKPSTDIVHEKFITLKGEVRDVEIASIMLEYNGKHAIQSSIRDITQQKKTADELIESNNALETIINSSPLAIYVVDTEGNVQLWNPVCEKVFGWKEKEVLGKPLPIVQKNKSSEFKTLLHELLKGKAFSKDLVRQRKDGSEVHVNISASPLYNAEKEVVAAVAITSDISERKKTEALLLDSERKYRMMIEQSLLSTQILSPDGWTLHVNKAWERLWGLKFEQLKGYNMLKDKQLEEKGILQYIKKGFGGEATMIPAIKYEPDRTLKNVSGVHSTWVQAFIYPVKDDSGKIREVVLVHEDVTARKEYERQKDDFLGIASHELKTPVTSIKMYGQVLNKMFSKNGDEKAVELMTKMDSQINKLTSLITDLLDVTKIQAGRLQFDYANFDFNELIKENVEELQHTTEKHKLIVELGPTKQVYGDRERIGQVITNFITNAIKYSPNAHTVIISTKYKNGRMTFCVQDFGIGISAEDLAKIFEQFYRSSITQKTSYPGLGLGLFISKEIISRHNGKIWVKESSKKGTTFCFEIPLKGDVKKE